MFTEKSIIIKRKISQTALFFILMLVLLAYDSYSQYNTAFGLNSLSSITTGTRNSAFGSSTLRLTTTGWYNSAFGLVALELNTTGSYNTALGTISLNNNISGNDNTAVGTSSLQYNTIGNYNSALGSGSLQFNDLGSYNTGIGTQSLRYSTGSYNTAIGMSSGYNITSGSNNIAIGRNSLVPSGTGSNQVRIGKTSITYAGIQVPWTITSDRRWKENILSSNLGLGFISKLNPVSYTRKSDNGLTELKTEYGLIAQEVEAVLKEEGVENTGMLTITDEGYYELRYNDFLAPMIKAIQELKKENEGLKEKLAEYDKMQNILTGEIEKIKRSNTDTKEIKMSER